MDKEKYQAIASNYMNMVYRTAISYTASCHDADDITQIVFLKLYQNNKPFQDEEHIRRWLLRVTANECKRLWASNWRKRVDIVDEYPELTGQDTPEYKELWEAILRLPAKLRIVLHLYYFEGYQSKEIAEILSIRHDTVRNRLSRARKMLKVDLSKCMA